MPTSIPVHMQACEYCSSVLSYADRNGNLSKEDTYKLLNDHGTNSFNVWAIDGYDGGYNAVKLLQHLGY